MRLWATANYCRAGIKSLRGTPRHPSRTFKLQGKPSAHKREHLTLQNKKFPNFFPIFVGHFCHLDPDPDFPIPKTKTYGSCGSGSATLWQTLFLFHVRLPLLIHRAKEVAPEVALSGLEVRPLVGSAQRTRPEALVEDGRGSLYAAPGGPGCRGQPPKGDLRTTPRTCWHFAATSTNYVK